MMKSLVYIVKIEGLTINGNPSSLFASADE